MADGDENSTDRNDETSEGTVAENTDQEVAADAGREQPQPSQMESFFAITKTLILRGLIIYVIMSFFRRPQAQQEDGATAASRVQAYNIFENSSIMDMYVYLSEDEKFFKHDESKLIWQKNGLVYGDWTSGPNEDGTFTFETKFDTSENVRNNGSIFLHVFIVNRDKLGKNSEKVKLTGKHVTKSTKQLNRFKKLKFTKTQNLLTGETTLTAEEIRKAETLKQEIVSHWHPNMTINLVTDFTPWIQGSIPPPLNEYFEFVGAGDQYKPPIYFNEFWNMMRDYQPINENTTELELKLTYQPLSLLRWQIYSAQSMRNKWTSGIFQEETDDEDQDSIKEALLDTSPYLLGATVIVSILHSVFELLAFKNDIQFWNNRKSLEGLSVRMVFFNVFQSVVILLYVFDNETNMLIRISCFFSLAIEIWKINKVVDISFDFVNRILWIFPRIKFTDKGSYVESSTKEYDQLAFKYLSWALYPCLFGYAVYSLLYQEHKGWYSWVLNMLYGFLLTFGFIMMTPQLFINYKLKSVAHLPWRMLSYKCLNTFIDDIFAFVIKMPTMYRLGCFRDDIVFFIFLYQRWMYKTDLSRVNEFGYSGDMEEDANKQKPIENGSQKAIMDKKKD